MADNHAGVANADTTPNDAAAEREYIDRFVQACWGAGLSTAQSKNLIDQVQEVPNPAFGFGFHRWVRHCWDVLREYSMILAVAEKHASIGISPQGEPFFEPAPHLTAEDTDAIRGAKIRTAIPPAEAEQNRKLENLTEPELAQLMKTAAHAVEGAFRVEGCERPLFCLLVFNDQHQPQYVGNCERGSMVQALKAAAERIGSKLDTPRPNPISNGVHL